MVTIIFHFNFTILKLHTIVSLVDNIYPALKNLSHLFDEHFSESRMLEGGILMNSAEYLNSLNTFRLSPSKLKLKVEYPVMILLKTESWKRGLKWKQIIIV
jgi:hypothetical protein